MDELYLVGAGGHGREILDVVDAINAVSPSWHFAGFVADEPADAEVLARRDASVVLSTSELAGRRDRFVLAIGDGATRLRLDTDLAGGDRSPSLVHPDAHVADGVSLGAGVLVPAGCEIGAGAVIGRHTTLNVNVTIGAGARLGAFATVSPGCIVGDGVHLDEGVFLGTGARIAEAIRIGEWARVGAGASVDASVPARATVVGRPARVVS